MPIQKATSSALRRTDRAWVDTWETHALTAQWGKWINFGEGLLSEVVFAFAGCEGVKEEDIYFKIPPENKSPRGIPKRRCLYKRVRATSARITLKKNVFVLADLFRRLTGNNV